MKFRLALALIALATITRLTLNLLPTPPHNFSPIAAMGLFGAAYMNRRWLAIVVPFAALFLSDLFLNNVVYSQFYTQFTWITSGWIYAAFAMVIFMGWLLLRQKATPARIFAASLAASVIFFLVTNYSVWAEGVMYPKSFAGLLMCYTAGLPFLGNTILGDLFFSTALFGTYYLITSRQTARQLA